MGRSIRFPALIPLLAAGACATFAAAPAWAQIYKWVDNHGVVNYSNKPPTNRKAKELDLSTIRVSVYPAEKPGQRAAEAAKSDVAALSDKIDRLQHQLEAERQARQYAAADTRAAQVAYDQCLAERRVDCSGIHNSSYPYGPMVVFVPRLRRFHAVPIFPVSLGTVAAGNFTAGNNVTAGNFTAGNNVTAGNFTTFSTFRPAQSRGAAAFR
jgi:hypothetical protein